MSAIGVIIVLLQVFPSLGLHGPTTTLDVVRAVLSGSGFEDVNFQALGMMMASLWNMCRMSQEVEDNVELEPVSAIKSEQNWTDEYIPAVIADCVLVKRIAGPLFFGFASGFQQQLSKLPDVRYVILRMGRVPLVDQSGADALNEALGALHQRGVKVLVAGLREQPGQLLRNLQIVPLAVSEQQTFDTFATAVEFVRVDLLEPAS